MWVANHDLPRSAAHPFYTRLNQLLDEHDFDGHVEGLCQRFYAGDGRPGLAPGRYLRLLLIGCPREVTHTAQPARVRCNELRPRA